MTVHLIFTTTYLPFSWLIRIFTFSDFSHVGVVKDEVVWEALAAEGVVKGPLTKYTKHRAFGLSRYDIYKIDDFPEEKWPEVQKFLDAQLKKKYDWKAIFGFGFRKEGYQDSNKWFCSEYVAVAFSRVGFKLVNDYSWRIAPRDLRISSRLSFISSWKK